MAFNVAFSIIFYFSTHLDGDLGFVYPFRMCVCVCVLQIQEAGFDIVTSEERTMTEAEMRLFYQHRAGEVSSSAPRSSHSHLFSSGFDYRL